MQKHPGKLVFCTAAVWCLFLFCTTQSASPQQSSPAATAPASSPADPNGIPAPVEHDGIYEIGNGVLPPKAFQSAFPDYPAAAQKAHIEGTCVLSVVVDKEGKPHKIKVLQPLGKGLDKSAATAVKQYRFTPAILDGKPVPARINVSVQFTLPKNSSGPASQVAGAAGQTSPPAQSGSQGLGSAPGQRITIEQPIRVTSGQLGLVLIRQVAPEYPYAAKSAHIEGTCVIEMTINTKGVPEDFHIEQSAGSVLDASALEAVKQYRYHPAVLNGKPVAIHTRVKIIFRLP